jgi:hypothetical protein
VKTREDKPRIVWSVPHTLIMQAERDADGKVWYVVVERRAMRKVSADDYGLLTPLEAK